MKSEGVPIVAQWKGIWPASMRMQVWSLAPHCGLRIQRCCELWYRLQAQLRSGAAVGRPTATALIWHLAWEPPYVKGVALKSQKERKEGRKERKEERKEGKKGRKKEKKGDLKVVIKASSSAWPVSVMMPWLLESPSSKQEIPQDGKVRSVYIFLEVRVCCKAWVHVHGLWGIKIKEVQKKALSQRGKVGVAVPRHLCIQSGQNRPQNCFW